MLRLKDKPFELVNISVDDTRGEVEGLLRAKTFPGLHIWHEKGFENPVRVLYNAQRFPTQYVIDAKGVIRARDPRPDDLMKVIEAAMKPAKKE